MRAIFSLISSCYNKIMNETKPDQSPEDNQTQPVAYDANNQPLYTQPPQVSPQIVHLSRSVEPTTPNISPAAQQKHERSQKLYPSLNLSAGEFVVREVDRHPIGLAGPVVIGLILAIPILFAMFNYDTIVDTFNLSGRLSESLVMIWPLTFLLLLVVLGVYAAYYIYISNKFYLTNESIIQEIQTSLFARKEQTVSLANIEDTSYRQYGILQQIFNYGSIRLSTEGDETTYRFNYVARPKEHVAILNNAVEAFKNGRPIPEDD